MFRRALMSAACVAICLAGNGATRKYEGLKYSTTAVKGGVWSTQFAKCKQYAQKHGIPFVVMWVNPGCGHCRALCNALVDSSFAEWQKACGYVFVLGIGTKTKVGAKVKEYAKTDGKTKLNTFPFCAVYLNPLKINGKRVSPTIKRVFTGSGLTADAFRKKIKSVRKKYAKINVRASKGGVVNQVCWQKLGKTVTLRAVSNRGWRLVGWYDAKGKRVSKKATFKVKVRKSTTYRAKFKKE